MGDGAILLVCMPFYLLNGLIEEEWIGSRHTILIWCIMNEQ